MKIPVSHCGFCGALIDTKNWFLPRDQIQKKRNNSSLIFYMLNDDNLWQIIFHKVSEWLTNPLNSSEQLKSDVDLKIYWMIMKFILSHL